MFRRTVCFAVLVGWLMSLVLTVPAAASQIGGAPIPVPDRPVASEGSVQSDGGETAAREGGTVKPTPHTATRYRPGKIKAANRPKTVRHPSQMKLRLASSRKLDLRKLRGHVVRHERPETDVPYGNYQDPDAAAAMDPDAQVGSGDAAALAALPHSVDPASVNRGVRPRGAAPAASHSFDGLDFTTWGAGHPPDENGDVGPTYYIETVNTSIGVYRKSDGAQVAAFTFNAFMSAGNFGNVCDTNNFGDPVVLYDSFEDRWVLTDFAFTLVGGSVSPQHVYECIAVSKTGDPVSGGWNFYSVETQGGLGDYPKLGVWRDGIYMSVNMFGYAAGSSFISPRVYAIDKAQMYAGAPTALQLSFDAPSNDFTLIPANARLQAGTPPEGTPEYFVSTWQFLNALTVYTFKVDWDAVSTSTFSGPFIPLAPTSWPNAAVANAPSQGGNSLDVLQIRAMAQAQYSNIGGTESLWADHTVRRQNTTGFAAPRWYQLDVTGGTVAANTLQAATWDPDGANVLHRFVPSLAVDHEGDLAMGYTTSSSTTKPAIAYAGRLAGDPVNTFSQTEQLLIQGTGTQTGNCGGSACTRWGDYSGMALDPTDGCTFWMVGEYYAADGLDDQTRIGAFSYPSCTPVGNGVLQGTVTNGNGHVIEGATVSLGSRNTTTDSNGDYQFTIPAGTYPTLAAAAAGYGPDSTIDVDVPDGGTATRDFTLTGSAQAGCLTDTTKGDFQAGLITNCDVTGSPGDVTLLGGPQIDQQNTTLGNSGVGITVTTYGGQTFTPSYSGSLTEVDVNLFCSGCTGTTPNLALSIRATSGGLPTGADLATGTVTGFSSGSASFHTATLDSPLAVTSGTQYAIVIHPTVNPSPGTYALTRSGTSTSGSDVYAGGTRVSGATSGTVWSVPLTGGVSTDAGFKVLIDGGFRAPGNLISSVKDANPDSDRTANWTTLSFNANTPAGTDVKFQVAASDSVNGPFSFVGPDGTAATYFTASGADLSEFNGHRYLRYKAYLSTSDTSATPTLQDVTICYLDVPAPTTTAITSDLNPSAFGQQVTFTATVSANEVGAGTPTGDVQFNIDGTDAGGAVRLVGGKATYQTDTLSVASHTVMATYAGNATYGSSHDSLNQRVVRSRSTTTLATSANPADFAQNVTFTATVSAAAGSTVPSGTVDFTDVTTNVSLCAGVSLNGAGTADCVTGDLIPGSHQIRAHYSGDTSFAASNGSTIQVIRRVATTVALRSSPQPSVHGQGVRLIAQVQFSPPAPGTPTGTVTFRTETSVLCANVPIDTGGRAVCGPLTDLPTGANTLLATYHGDAGFRPSTSPPLVHVVKPAPTETAVNARPNPVSAGATITLIANVTTQAPGHGVPEGKVQFAIDGVRVGSPVTVVNGHASLQITVSLKPGQHGLRAYFHGSSDYVSSSSSALPLIVQ